MNHFKLGKKNILIIPLILLFLGFDYIPHQENKKPDSFKVLIPISGNKMIGGSTPDYVTLTQAFTDINANGLSGNVNLILQPGYTGTGETYPIETPLPSSTGIYTVTVYPSVTGFSISSSNATGTININGSKNIIFDGRVGGSGSALNSVLNINGNRSNTFDGKDGASSFAKDLIIENTSVTGYAIQFINDATNNTVRYCKIKGVNTSLSSGVIVFGETTGTTGNDNNTIDNCDIRDGASTPCNAIIAAGTTTSVEHYNSGITISNNNIFNFFKAGGADNGIFVATGNTDWTITGNNFYQTAGRTYTADANHIAIKIANSTGNNFIITNNFIGGGAPSCGGTAWSIAGGYTNRFRGISLFTGNTAASSVQGNTIANFNHSSTDNSTSEGGPWVGIYLTAGKANVGNVTGNTIGSGTGNGSLTLTTITFGGGVSSGIYVDAPSTVSNISNNTIGSVTISTGSVSYGFSGIVTTAGSSLTINNNLIGSTATSNSINVNTGYIGSVTQQLKGISNTSPAVILITNNTVANLNNNYLPSTANVNNILGGIFSSSGVNIISGNTIRNLSTGANGSGSGSGASVIGISLTSATAGQTVSQNTIHTLSNSNGSGPVKLSGINWAGPVTGTNLIAGNFIHSLSLVSTNSATEMVGIYFTSGLLNIQNNMIRLGIDASGNSLTKALNIKGIYETATVTGGSGVYNNSVYIGGSGVLVGSQVGTTFALLSQSTNIRAYLNNILINARSNVSVSGVTQHYALSIAGTGTNPSGLTSNFNIIQATGTNNSAFGIYDGNSITNLTSWRNSNGQDYNSGSGNPNFINATGNSSAVDLHVQSSTPAEGSGIIIASVTDDFDGNTRSGLTPVDIGADAGNFTFGPDIFCPALSYTPLGNTTSWDNRTISNVTITDVGSGVPTSGVNIPRIWFKNQTANSIWASTPGTKTSGDKSNQVWSFTIDYSLIGGTGWTGGIQIIYYITAQDQASPVNMGYSPFIGASHSDVNTQLSPPSAPNSYYIGNSGTFNIGSGQTYTSLTGDNPGGFFNYLNNNILAVSNITLNITSDLTETGEITLNQWAEQGNKSIFTLTIQPGDAAIKNITGNAANGLIRFNGADKVIIDGRFNGSGKYLRFENTNTTAPVFTFTNDASNNIIRDCNIEGSSTSVNNGVIFFSAGATTGNDSNIVNKCVIKNGSAGIPKNLIYSSGSSPSVTNTGNTISENEISDFSMFGIRMTSTGNENWTISRNNIKNNSPAATDTVIGIHFNSLGTNLITRNNISGLSALQNCDGIFLNDAKNTEISRNYISIIPDTNNIDYTIDIGIYIEHYTGSATEMTIANNRISLASGPAQGSLYLHGIVDWSNYDDFINVYYNTVFIGGTESYSGFSTAYLRLGNTNSRISNNIFYNNRTGGNDYLLNNNYAFRNSSGIGSYSVSNNFYAGTGPLGSANKFMCQYYEKTFSEWVTAKNDIYSYGSVASGLTAANLFTDASAGLLDIIKTNSECWYVKGKGMPLTEYADDYSATGVRSTTPASGTTCIGSEEFTTSTTPPVATASGSPSGNGTTSYSQVNRKLLEITWGASDNYQLSIKNEQYKKKNPNNKKQKSDNPDVLPSTLNVLYYSGMHPPDTTSAFTRTGLGYWMIDASNDPINAFNIKIYYGDHETGDITDTSKLILAMYDMKNRVWLPFEKGYSGNGYSIINHTDKSVTVNGLTRIDSVIFALTDKDQPLKRLLLELNCIISGFWYDHGNGYSQMKPDTIKAIIRTSSGPYSPVDTVMIRLDSSGYGYGYSTLSSVEGTGYYISVEHRNSLSTWTADGTNIFSRVTGIKGFDFTNAQSQAYGNNLIQIGTKWCIINGDISRDDYIDGSDYLDIINNYDMSGEYMNADANGDDYIDGSDYLPVINNYDVGAVTPTAPFKTLRQKLVKSARESINKFKNKINERKSN